ncbi:hypothetical protein ACFX2H_009484 [Malus domestica]
MCSSNIVHFYHRHRWSSCLLMLGLQWGISLELRIGMYAGLATVGIFVIWHTHGFSRVLISVGMAPPVSHNPSSPIGDSLRFSPLIITPVMISMVSLFVLIPIKMFNSLGALSLSEDRSLVPMPHGKLLAPHGRVCFIWPALLYPPCAILCSSIPCCAPELERAAALAVAFPVVLVNMILKFVERWTSRFQLSHKQSP